MHVHLKHPIEVQKTGAWTDRQHGPIPRTNNSLQLTTTSFTTLSSPTILLQTNRILRVCNQSEIIQETDADIEGGTVRGIGTIETCKLQQIWTTIKDPINSNTDKYLFIMSEKIGRFSCITNLPEQIWKNPNSNGFRWQAMDSNQICKPDPTALQPKSTDPASETWVELEAHHRTPLCKFL